jgi:hypothetical protein
MKSVILLPVFLLLVSVSIAQKAPDGYIQQYTQGFQTIRSLDDFDFNYALSWGISKTKENSFLKLNHLQNGTIQASPQNRAIFSKYIFGDFILEAEVMPLTDTSPNAELCIFLGFKDSTGYYCITLFTEYEKNLQGIFLMKDSMITQLQTINNPIFLHNNTWQKIRVERNIVKRTILVYISDMNKPVLEVKDYELIMGKVGFGSVNNRFCVDNILIMAPTVIPAAEIEGLKD